MKTTSGILAGAVLCALVNSVVCAQTQTSTDEPIHWISITEFNQMVQQGLLTPSTQSTLNRQNQQDQAAYLQNQAIVSAYLKQNPDLTNLARLVNTVPSDEPNSDGNYEITIPLRNGGSQTVATLGEEDKFASLADAITSSQLPTVQLQLYTDLYNRLPAELLRSWPNGQPPIAPSQLQGASLQTIQNAMQSFVSQWSGILKNVPLPSLTAVACSAEIGASGTPNIEWGDQTKSAGCTTPSPNGVYANFDFPAKGLLSCIKEQGSRGTCHIFAATSAVEELIARDTGVFVNLSEEDFQEHVKLLWVPALYSSGGDSGRDLNKATENGYKFAYENQWDYNPSYGKGVDDVDSCKNYPSSSEPGCSNSASQAPEYCALESSDGVTLTVCGFSVAAISGRSPYAANGANNVWNHKNTGLSVDFMILALGLNEGVDLAFTETPNFGKAKGGFVAYETSDLAESRGGHVVHVVGYVDNTDLAKKLPSAPLASGGGYFIIKNSWGACSGDAGYWYMPVDYVKAQARDVDIVSSVIE